MKPEKILQSDMLDILFENRNKDYGAYNLRRNYNKRLLQSIGGTMLLATVILALQSMKPAREIAEIPHIDSVRLVDLFIPKDDKIEPKQKKETPSSTKTPTVTNPPPIIVPDDLANDNHTTVDRLANSDIGDHTDTTGTGPTSGWGGAPTGGGGGNDPVGVKDPDVDPNVILLHADVMPEFPGDIVRFMLRNLRQPNDMEEGDKIVVRARFVVTREGDITDVEIIQSGREDLDREVIRVIKKMPKWKPGIQGGINVPVYFVLPVTFVSNG
jgi:protein TonB